MKKNHLWLVKDQHMIDLCERYNRPLEDQRDLDKLTRKLDFAVFVGSLAVALTVVAIIVSQLLRMEN